MDRNVYQRRTDGEWFYEVSCVFHQNNNLKKKIGNEIEVLGKYILTWKSKKPNTDYVELPI